MCLTAGRTRPEPTVSYATFRGYYAGHWNGEMILLCSAKNSAAAEEIHCGVGWGIEET